MPYKILYNDNDFTPAISDLPCLITYGDKTWWSQFSMTMLAHLCLSGQKAIVLTAYPMAQENFEEQVEWENISIWHISTLTDIEHNKDEQVIFIESWNSDLFIATLNQLEDIDERIVFIKNFEIFEKEVILECLQYNELIISGNIDNCSIKEKVWLHTYNTIIAFSEPTYKLPIKYIPQEKYIWYIEWKDKIGTIKIQHIL